MQGLNLGSDHDSPVSNLPQYTAVRGYRFWKNPIFPDLYRAYCGMVREHSCPP